MYGLVLEGGGARGAYHIGVYKAILEEGIEIGGITGTSIGALNGAMIVQGDYERCYELWQNLSYSMLIDDTEYEIEKLKGFKFDKEDLLILSNYLKNLISNRGLDIKPFKRMLDTYIDEERIRNSALDFGIVTINLTDMKSVEIFKEDIPQGEIKDYLLASSYLPVFRTEKLGGKKYLDGGFFDNLPFRMLKKKGYNDLIIVRTHAKGFVRKVNIDKVNAIIISPTEDIGRTLTLDSTRAKKTLELGYYDGLRAFRHLKGFKYYIEAEEPMEYYFKMLLDLDEDQVEKIILLVKTPDLPYRRALFEYVIPKLGSILGLHKEFTYEEFIISLLEKKADEAKIDRFRIYKFKELLSLVKCETVTKIKSEEKLTTMEKFIERVDISTLFNKDDVILQITDIIFCKNEE
jgi:NTE family protein